MATRLKSVFEPPDDAYDGTLLESEGAAFEMRRLVTAMAERKMESLKLYRPSPQQQAFHNSMAKERVARGGNRSAKTTVCAAEVARIVTGQDTLNRCPKENGVCYIVGFDGKHIADPMWLKLGGKGPFESGIIRDELTGDWRIFYPQLPGDVARIRQVRPCLPFIPERMIAAIAWEEKKTLQPKVVTLVNGWSLHFYSGNAKPPQGSVCDLAWFDEELPSGEWYNEIAMRLASRNGYFIWSATPQIGTDQLYRLHERAELQVEKNTQPRTVEEFVFHIRDNIFMTEEAKAIAIDKLDDDALEIRVEGEFAGVHRVYPEWQPKVHEVPYREIPDNWTRYVGIDPGYQVCAGLFLAVPPPTAPEAGQLYIYDEFYIKNGDALAFGLAMRDRCRGQRFRAFIIDPNEAPKHFSTSVGTVEDHHRAALKGHNIRSELSGHGFIYGDDDRKAATATIRGWIRNKTSMIVPEWHERQSALRVLVEKCPNLCREIRHLKYKKLMQNGKMTVTDDPDERRNTHAFACLRYLAQSNPRWVPPTKQEIGPGGAYAAWQRKLAKKDEQSPGGYGMLLGPGAGA